MQLTLTFFVVPGTACSTHEAEEEERDTKMKTMQTHVHGCEWTLTDETSYTWVEPIITPPTAA